jgi:uncharacterized protein YndB with AHSA1/START domain
MTASEIKHSTFVIERELPGRPRHAFRFWSDPKLKKLWTGCHPDWIVLEDRFDFRIGGEEAIRWQTPEGHEQGFDAHYLDIVPERRIIYAFAMTFKGESLSASLATIELIPAGAATRMIFTEQIAFFGDADAYGQRVVGTEGGFDRLVEVVARQAAT